MAGENPEELNEGEPGPIPFDDGDEVAGEGKERGSVGDSEAQGRAAAGGGEAVSEARISGVKTFYTKLHPGAIEFLDEQVKEWLRRNPGIEVKRTNTAVGDVQGKKTEPNILVTVWY